MVSLLWWWIFTTTVNSSVRARLQKYRQGSYELRGRHTVELFWQSHAQENGIRTVTHTIAAQNKPKRGARNAHFRAHRELTEQWTRDFSSESLMLEHVLNECHLHHVHSHILTWNNICNILRAFNFNGKMCARTDAPTPRWTRYKHTVPRVNALVIYCRKYTFYCVYHGAKGFRTQIPNKY